MRRLYGFLWLILLPLYLAAQDEHALQFTENRGQWDARVLFRARLSCGYVYLERKGITIKLFKESEYLALKQHDHAGSVVKPDTLHGHVLRYHFPGSSGDARVYGSVALGFHRNYFLGRDTSRWASNAAVFGEVRYDGLWPGIGLRVYSQHGLLKYEWDVAPGADPGLISLRLLGQDSIGIRENNLLIHTSIGTLTDRGLKAWQVNRHTRENMTVKAEYALTGMHLKYHFPSGYLPSLPLIIDPILVFSTYSGSEGDNFGYTATYDVRGNLYAGGITDNTEGEYPVTTGAFRTVCKGGLGRSPVNLACDITISKYDSTGSKLLYATYIGGVDDDYPHSMVVNGDTELVVFGTTYSEDFPVTLNAYDRSHNSFSLKDTLTDIIVFKLSVNGDRLQGSTFFGGSEHDGLTDGPLQYNYADEFRGEVLTDRNDNIYVVSSTNSPDIPLVNPGKTKLEGSSDGLCLKFSKNLDKLFWATYFGGNSSDGIYSLEFDKLENIYVAGGTLSTNLPTIPSVLGPKNHGGIDGFMAVFNHSSLALDRATYYGTSTYDQIYFLEIDKQGDVYATGQTEGNITPSPGVYTHVTNSGQFILKADPALSTIVKQTVFGSRPNNPNISPSAFLVDSCGSIYLSGWGSNVGEGHIGTTRDLPITANALQTATDGSDFYLIVLGKNLSSLLFATYFGGNKSRDHVDGGTSRFDKRGVIYQSVCSSCPNVPGATLNDFPTTSGSAFPVNVSWRCSNAAFKIDFRINSVTSAKFIPDVIACGPADVQFLNQSSGGGKYLWNFGDGKTATEQNPKHSFPKVGIYTVKLQVIDSNTCNVSDTAIRTVKVVQRSESGFEISGFDCASQIELKNTSKLFSTSFWDFGDTTTSDVNEPGIHSYKRPGKYTIRLITDAGSPCPDTTEIPVDVTGTPADKLVLANVFTPDGDGINDCFHFDGMLNGCSKYKLTIYNRWGLDVFKTKDFDECWNGRVNNTGGDCPEGTYFWICEYKGESPVISPLISGTVTLIRDR